MGQTLLRVLIAQRMVLPQERYAYLEGLSIDNLPTDGGAGSSYDICSWYAQWNDRSCNLNSIRHNVIEAATVTRGLRVEPLAPPFLLLRGTANFMRLLVWCFVATFVAGFDLLRGRWWHSLLLSEATLAKAVSLTSAKVLAVDYLFHYSGNTYRPLWTYEAEKKGARIICYFYSTFEQPMLTSGYESQKFEWGAASWPIYLVWDKYQEAQLRRDLGDEPEIRVVGPIWFTAGTANLELKSNPVAVFDVEAHRLAAHFPFSTAGDYIAAHSDLSERFLRDIQSVLKEHGLSMAFKSKRHIGHRGTKKYKKLIHDIADLDNVYMVPTNAATLRLIEQCVGMISMPFTSTALYLRECNIPSVYYDPTGWIQRHDRAAHGIPVLIGIEELRQWISSMLPEGRT
jgi:polysaccharide biosynthesis PFTS motif protein